MVFDSFGCTVNPSEKNRQWPQIVAVFTACLTTFNSGMQIAWMSPSVPKLISNTSSIPMTFEDTAYFVVIQSIGMCFAAPPSTFLMNYFGYKKVILFVAVPQLIGWLLTGFSVNVTMLYVARIFAGIADALVYAVVPVYVGEVCEKQTRGPMGCFLMVDFYMGQLVMNAIGYYFDISTAAFIICTFPILHFICFLFMPESPYWLIKRERLKEGKKQLQILRWRENVEEEFSEIENSVRRQLSESSSIKEVFTVASNRRAFFMAMNTRFAQQFCGMSAFFIYLQYIFLEAGGDIPSHISSMICMGLLAVGSLFSSTVINRFGRRPLFLLSGTVCIVVLVFQTIYFYLKTVQDVSAFGWFPLVSMLIYIVGYSFGYCVIPNMVLGELFSAGIKGKAVTLANVWFGIFVIANSKIFQVLTDNFGIYTAFLFFVIVTSVMNTILYFTLIETKNKTLDEIQKELKK